MSVALIDLSALTDAQLATLQADALANLGRSANAQTYQIGSRSLSRRGATVDLDLLDAVNSEITSRTQTNGPAGVIEFGEPE